MTDAFLATAVEAARAAGAVLEDHFGGPLDVQFKGTVDLVTQADRAAEALIAERLRSAFPDHRLMGEEGARATSDEAAASPFRWLIDPLDGTTNFAHGLPTFAVSIALEASGIPVIGVVYDPMRDELFTARRGQGALLNGVPIRVSNTDALISSILATGFSYDFAKRVHQAEIWRDFLTRVQAIRQTGSAALNLCYIAAGRLDGYWERGIQPWDVAAGALMVVEAGGTVSDLAGGVYRSDDREILASNGSLHDQLLAVIGRHPFGDAPPATIQLGA